MRDLHRQPDFDFAYLDALRALRSAGHEVIDSDIPGLKFIDGRELTMGQVIDLAAQLRQH